MSSKTWWKRSYWQRPYLWGKTQKALEEKLGCKFIRTNTTNAKNSYDLDYEVSDVQAFIDEFKNKKIKTRKKILKGKRKRQRTKRKIRKRNKRKLRKRNKRKIRKRNKRKIRKRNKRKIRKRSWNKRIKRQK